ncbi:MAG: hypothetical protein LBK94_06165 [Prevotellaceae bacterium]|jgi:hypothetical protein|nr:hypothetical protein [Prevotellaceae bacterium]
MNDSITLDYYMFLLSLGISYDGFVTDEDGTVYRSISEPVIIPPESLYIGSPPGVNYDRNTFTLLTKSTLYYFPQDNMPDTDDIARKIRNRAIRVNSDGTTAVDFGRGDIMVVPTDNCEIKVSVTGSSDSLSSPVVHIRVRDGSSGKTKETTMTLGAAETVYGSDYTGITDAKNLPDVPFLPSETGSSGEDFSLLNLSRSLTVAGFAASALELGAGQTTYRMYRMRGQTFSPKLYRSGWHGGSRGQIKTHSAKNTLKKAGRAFWLIGIYFEISDFANEKQSFEKAFANIIIGGISTMGPAGLVIGIAYFGLDLLGVFDGRGKAELRVQTLAPDYNSPADNTRIFIPDILIEDGLDSLQVDAEYLQRFILDR